MNDTVGTDRTSAHDDPSARPALLALWDQRAVFKPFGVAGCIGIVAGGVLASAIAAPAPTRHGVWAVAYLVLVIGVGQLVIGAGQALLPAEPPSPPVAAVITAAFNVAGGAIVLGVVTDRVLVFDLGSALLFVTLARALYSVRRGASRGWALVGYRLFLLMLIVSIPIGALVTTAGRG